MLAAVIYCRCSTEEESQVDALRKQVIEAENCVHEQGWTLVDRYVESKSGTTSKGREQYSRLLEDMATAKFDIIVIKSQDRLMRNTKDWYLFLDRMQTNGKRLYLYLERKFYTTDDALITGIKAILAEEYSRELSRKINNAHANRQKNGGRVMMTDRVFGYRKMPDGSVCADEEEAEIIRRIYLLCKNGYGSRTIANMLEAEGVRSHFGKVMTPAAVRRVIRNPMYQGIFVMNRAHYDFETKRLIQNPKNQWIYQKGVVPAIVDGTLWKEANDAMSMRAESGNRGEKHIKGSNPGKYMLSGKLVCGICGMPYYRNWRRAYADPEKIIIEWKCSSYVEHGRKEKKRRDRRRKLCSETDKAETGCDNIHLDEGLVYELLEQLCARHYQMEREEKEGIIQRTLEILEKALETGSDSNQLSKLENRAEDIHKRRDALLDKLLDGIISDENYLGKDQQLKHELEKVEEQKKQLEGQLQDQKSLKERINGIKNRLEQGGIEQATVGQMLAAVSGIFVHEWQLEVRFDSLVMAGISGGNWQQICGELTEPQLSVWLDYPFPPATEKGRVLDRLRIMELLESDGTLTAAEIAQRMERSAGIVRNRMRELKREGYIQFCRSGGESIWKVLKKMPDPRVIG